MAPRGSAQVFSTEEIDRKMGRRPIFGHKGDMRALYRAWLHGSLVLAGVASNGCTDAPSVEVAVRVDDLEAQTQHGAIPSWGALRSHLSALEDAAQVPGPAQPVGPGLITDTPKSPAALRRALAALDRAPQEELPGIVFHLRELDPSLWPVVDAELRAAMPRPKGDYKAVLDVIGGDVPNRYGHFARAWKRRHGYAVKLSSDWVGDLLALPESELTRGLRPVQRELLRRSVLAHAAAGIGGQDAAAAPAVVETLLDVAYAKGGVMRDEVTRAFAALDPLGLPTLVRRSRSPTDDPERAHELPVRQSRYARFLLDRFDRWLPARAVAPLRQRPDVLESLLAAYGEVRFKEAAPLLLDFADDDTPAVREAARAGFARYLDGRAPSIQRKTLRLLGGRRSHERAGLTFRGQAMLSLTQRLETAAPEVLEQDPPCESRLEDGTPDLQCRLRPQRLLAAYLETLDARRGAHARAEIERADQDLPADPVGALRRLDGLLSVGDDIFVSEALAARYEQIAGSRASAGELAGAAELLRKAAFLVESVDPAGARALRRRAITHEADLPGLGEEGRAMLIASVSDAPQGRKAPLVATLPASERARALTVAVLLAMAILITAILGGRFALKERRDAGAHP